MSKVVLIDTRYISFLVISFLTICLRNTWEKTFPNMIEILFAGSLTVVLSLFFFCRVIMSYFLPKIDNVEVSSICNVSTDKDLLIINTIKKMMMI